MSEIRKGDSFLNDRKSLYDIAEFYRKKAVLNASYRGMRYQVRRKTWTEGDQECSCLVAAIWPEPFCYEKTPEEKRESREFPYEEESLDLIHAWLCERYEQDQEYWEQSGKNTGYETDYE
ncbi:MAG: hypothetical protein K2J67_11175 [Lachnospiraceae bacterium]|nr:hypothetical protein [Lachnospiraceae bacterium]